MQCWLQEVRRRDASINDVHLLDSGRRPTERRLSSSGFRGQVDVLMNNGVQRFQPLEEGQRLSVLAGLVVAYVDNFLIDMDVQVDGFLHGEALRGECSLEVHILCHNLRQLQGHQCFKEFVTLEADEGGRQQGAWACRREEYGKVVRALLVGGELAESTIISHMREVKTASTRAMTLAVAGTIWKC